MSQAQADFASSASEETIQRVAQRIRERNIEVVVVDDGDQARKAVLERLPAGAEVHSGRSKTLQDAGIFDAIHDESHYHALRPRIYKMDRQTQAREIRKLISGPDFMLGSVNAITEGGVLETALRRIHNYVLPWEDAQIRKMMNRGSFVGKILLRQPIGI